MPRLSPQVVVIAPLLVVGSAAAQDTVRVPDPTPAPPLIEGSGETPWEPGRWTLQLEPTVWFAAMGGDVRAGAGSDRKFKDIGEGDHANAAASLRGLYRNDRWTVMVDGFWLDFDESEGSESLKFSLWSVDASVGWEWLEWKRQRETRSGLVDTGIAARVIPYAGLRLIAPDVDVSDAGGDFSGSDEFLHPFVGLRIELEIFDRVSIDTGADIGAIDLLGEEAFAFDWSLGLRAHITDNIAAQIGFRQIFLNVDSDDVEIDGSAGGLLLGVMVRF